MLTAVRLRPRRRVRVANWHRRVNWFSAECDAVIEQCAARGEWMERCRAKHDAWNKLSRREKKQDENALIFEHPPHVDYHTVYEGDIGDAGLLSILRTESTFVVDMLSVGALYSSAQGLYWAFPDAIIQIMRGGCSALAEVDPEIWTKIKSEDVVVERAAAHRIIAGRMSKDEVRSLCKSHRHRYDVMERFAKELAMGSRVRTWRCLVDANVESIIGDVHDHRWYESEEGHSAAKLVGTDAALKENSERYELAHSHWMRGATGGQERTKAAFHASMVLSSKQRRMLFEHATLEAYARRQGMSGGSLHLFKLLIHGMLFGIVDFSAGAIRAAPEAVGGPLIVCNGGGGYVYAGASDKMNLDKRKGVGLNYAQAAAFRALQPQTYGVRGMDWSDMDETTGITDTAISANISAKIVDGLVRHRNAPFKVPYRIVASEMTFDGGQSRLFSTLSSFIPRGREDGTTRTRELTQDAGAGRETVTWQQVIQPAVVVMGSNRVPVEQLERGEAIAHVCRCITASPVHHDAHMLQAGSASDAEKEANRSVFLDGNLAGMLVAFVQREGGVGELLGMLPTQRAITELFASNIAASRYMDHALITSNMNARIARGTETRAVCRTMILTGGTQFDQQEALPNAVKSTAKAAINCKFNPIALEVIPAMFADWLEQRVNTALIGILGVACVELKVPCYPLPVLQHWLQTGAFPPHPNMQHAGPARIQQWLAGMTAAEAVFEQGQLWITKDGRWVPAAAGQNNQFQNPNQPAAPAMKFQYSVFQCKEPREFSLPEFCTEIGAALLHEERYWAELHENFFMEARQAEFAVRHALATAFQPERGFLDVFPAIGSTRALLQSIGRGTPADFADTQDGRLCRYLAPALIRPAQSLAFDFRLLLLAAAIMSPRQAAQEGCMRREHITLACKSRWVCSVLDVFMSKIPRRMFPFPAVSLEIPGEEKNVAVLCMRQPRTRLGKLRHLLRREGVYVDPDEAARRDEDACTKNAALTDRLEYYVAPRMLQGDCTDSPSRMVEDVAGCDALIAACQCLALPCLRDFPAAVFHASIFPAQRTPVLHRATGRVHAYRYAPPVYLRAGDTPGVLTVYDGSADPARVSPAQPSTLDALGLVHIPLFFRPGVLLFVDDDESTWLAPTDGRFADVVKMSDADMRHTTQPSGSYAVIVPTTDGGEWLDESLQYRIVSRVGAASARYRSMGVSEVRRSLVPYGSDLLVNFTQIVELNLDAGPYPNHPWFVVPGVSHRHEQEAHVWATLSYVDEDDARCWHDGAFIDDCICVLVCEFATDFTAYSVDDEGKDVPTGHRTRRRHVVLPCSLQPIDKVKPAVRRSEYFVYIGPIEHWFGYFTRE